MIDAIGRGHAVAGRDRPGLARAPAGHPSVRNVAIFGFSRRLQGSAKRAARGQNRENDAHKIEDAIDR